MHYKGVKCKNCFQKFYTNESFTNHYIYFHQTKFYKCSFCNINNMSLQQIYGHFSMFHKTLLDSNNKYSDMFSKIKQNVNLETPNQWPFLNQYMFSFESNNTKNKFKTIDETMNNVLEKAFKTKIKLCEITTELNYLQSPATFKNKREKLFTNFSQTCAQKYIIFNNKIINIFQQTNKNTTKTNLKNASLKNVIFTQNSDAVFGNINLSYGFNCNNLNKKTKSKINNESQNDNTMKLILNLAVKTEFKLKTSIKN